MDILSLQLPNYKFPGRVWAAIKLSEVKFGNISS